MTDSESHPPLPENSPSDFIREIVHQDIVSGRRQQIVTRFPPEPNGYLHIGHAKSICLNFGIAREHGGTCHLRMDDTNPAKEELEYVDSIIADVRWLISGWADSVLGLKHVGQTPKPADHGLDFQITSSAPSASTPLEPFFASDYFEALYAFAQQLIRLGKAYVCDLTPDQTEQFRGAPDRPGQNSPYRNRSVDENLDLFSHMREGRFPDAACTLRAKIDMASPNIWMRDPVIYRIRHTEHHHTGNQWCIYPMYDFAHCLSDYIEGITHSICTLEFEVHRPLYDWILETLQLPRPLPHQYEFARLNLGFTVMSKRKLLQLVQDKIVTGWDDPRLPTISGLRRRGIPAAALRAFAQEIGVTKYNGLTDLSVFEFAVRNELNRIASRRMGVLHPVHVVLTNIPAGEIIWLDAVNNPEDPHSGTRRIPFSRDILIEQEDFSENPPPKYFRLRPGGDVRLKYACIIHCDEVVKNPAGEVIEVRCTADLESRSGGANAGRKVKGTIHWVSAPHAHSAEVRLYDRLFTVAEPDRGEGDFRQYINPDSLKVIHGWVEPSLMEAVGGDWFQLERIGYFAVDVRDSRPDKLVFNRTISLKDGWAKESARAP